MNVRNLALTLASVAALLTPSLASASTPRATSDPRLSVTLVNPDSFFRDIKVAGRSYTVEPHQALRITAPQGTTIYADSNARNFHRGDVVLQLSASDNNKHISLK